MKIIADLYDIWDRKGKDIILLDNNILAEPDHFIKICKQAQKEKLRLDFNQGLDIRLLTEELAQEIKKTKFIDVRFAFDNPSMKSIIMQKIEILKKYKIRGNFYCLVGYDSDFNEELERINYLLSEKQRVYVMRHEKVRGDKKYNALATWCNSPLFGRGTMPFDDFLKTERGKHGF